MNEQHAVPLQSWLIAPMDDEVSKAIQRLQRAPDVQRIAVMPDVHLAEDVCLGAGRVGRSESVVPRRNVSRRVRRDQ